MNLSHKIITGISFLILGGLSYVNRISGIDLNPREIFGITFVFYGILSVYLSLEDGRRDRLVFSSAVFLIGIALIIKSRFELMDERGLVLTSILFVGGTAFLILFMENVKAKVFLYSSTALVILGFLSTNVFKKFGLMNAANKIAGAAEMVWPVILIVLGFLIFVKRKN